MTPEEILEFDEARDKSMTHVRDVIAAVIHDELWAEWAGETDAPFATLTEVDKNIFRAQADKIIDAFITRLEANLAEMVMLREADLMTRDELDTAMVELAEQMEAYAIALQSHGGKGVHAIETRNAVTCVVVKRRLEGR